MKAAEIKTKHPIESLLLRSGVEKFFPSGVELKCRCPFHQDKNPSFSFHPQKQLWKCHAGCGGGDAIDFMAKRDGCSVAEVLRKFADADDNAPISLPRAPQPKPEPEGEPAQSKIVKTYSYTNAAGEEVFQVCRMEPKDFRQRHRVNGQWVWKMAGVERVLYRLHEVLAAETVWVVEGEKDADNLSRLGFCATCNVGGADKWLDSYSESLRGKEIVICGDNDEPGRKHVQRVLESTAAYVTKARVVTVPNPEKDISDFIGLFTGDEQAKAAVQQLCNDAKPYHKGVHVPLFTLRELESRYIEYAKNLSENTLDLGRWLPSLGRCVRGLVPGELVSVLADTGTGKTAILQNLADKTKPLPTVFFEFELPDTLIFERQVSINSGFPCRDIEDGYRRGDALGAEALGKLDHLVFCDEPKMTTERLETYINRSELKFGQRPKVVLVDYIGLMQGAGKSRYERMSTIAEELKTIAKATRTIIILASQVHRKSEDDEGEIFLHDAKDSGSVENSSGLVLGAWRNKEDSTLLHIKVLKNTKGQAGHIIDCNFNGNTLRITERSKIQS